MSYADFGGVERKIESAARMDFLFAALVAAWIPVLVSGHEVGGISALSWPEYLALSATTLVLWMLGAAANMARPQPTADDTLTARQDRGLFEVCRECGSISSNLPPHKQHGKAPKEVRTHDVGAELSELRSQVAMLNLLIGFSREVDGLCSPEAKAQVQDNLHNCIVIASTIYRLVAGKSAVGDLHAAGLAVTSDHLAEVHEDLSHICDTLRTLHQRWLGHSVNGKQVLDEIDKLEAQTARFGAVERLFFHTTVLLAEVAELTGLLGEGCGSLKTSSRPDAQASPRSGRGPTAAFYAGWVTHPDFEDAEQAMQLVLPLAPERLN